MFKLFNLFSPVVYLQLSPERLTMRNVRTGATLSEVPEIAIQTGRKNEVLDVGSAASLHRATPSVNVINPFSHPRTMVGDFTAGEQVLKGFFRKLTPTGLLAVSPRVVFHPLDDPAGGFTQVEIRAFLEMALGAGASDVTMWQGPALSDHEVLSGQFPSTGRVLG